MAQDSENRSELYCGGATPDIALYIGVGLGALYIYLAADILLYHII